MNVRKLTIPFFMLDGWSSSGAGHLDVLGSVPPEYRESILLQCHKRGFKRGQIIWNQGDPAGFVGFLYEGAAISTYHSKTGKLGVTGIWNPGDILGAADLGGYPLRQLTLRALIDTQIYTMGTKDFFRVVSRFPELAEAVIRALSVRIRWIAKLALTLETQSAFERVCTVLIAISEKFSVAKPEGLLLDLQLTNEHLASFVGVTRQFANSVLKQLESDGLIVRKGRRIIILDRNKLEQLIAH